MIKKNYCDCGMYDMCTVRPEPPTYRRESQYTVYPEHPYKSDTWRTKQGRGQSVGVSDTPKHLASEDTQSRQDTGVIEEATTGRSQGRGVARTTGPGSVGGRPVPIQRVWDPSDSPGLKEKVRDLGRDPRVRDPRSQVKDHRVRTHPGRAQKGVGTHTGQTRS